MYALPLWSGVHGVGLHVLWEVGVVAKGGVCSWPPLRCCPPVPQLGKWPLCSGGGLTLEMGVIIQRGVRGEGGVLWGVVGSV